MPIALYLGRAHYSAGGDDTVYSLGCVCEIDYVVKYVNRAKMFFVYINTKNSPAVFSVDAFNDYESAFAFVIKETKKRK